MICLYTDYTKPLPLGYKAAIDRALALRLIGRHISYPVISSVMAEYHGFKRSPSWWSHELRKAGAETRARHNRCIPPVHHRGPHPLRRAA